jgi:serine/threonine protein kinase
VIQQIHPSVDIVKYGGTKYVHKYMAVRSHAAHSFEFEITNYEKTVGSPYLMKLHYIVTYKDVNRGLLFEYASSKSLAHIRLTPSEVYSIIMLLLNTLCDLEACGYYPQDLKLPNILVSDDKRLLHIVDLGSGLTEGMYRLESERSILRGKMTGRDMCYTFGKMVSQLYYENDDVPPVETLPPLIRTIVMECCGNDLEPDIRVEDVHRKYCPLLAEGCK